MEKAYKFRIYPNNEQEQQIQRTFGCCRFVFNYFLAMRIDLYNENRETLGYNACCAALTKLKKAVLWLREPDATALQSTLRDLEIAYQNFFRRVKKGEKPGFPHFKSKRNRRKSYRSKRTGDSIAVLEGYVKLPKLGLVRAAISKRVKGRSLNATVSQSPSGKYYVSICCTDVEIPQYEATGEAVGLDMGLKDIAIASDGTALQEPCADIWDTRPHDICRNRPRFCSTYIPCNNYTKSSYLCQAEKRENKVRLISTALKGVVLRRV